MSGSRPPLSLEALKTFLLWNAIDLLEKKLQNQLRIDVNTSRSNLAIAHLAFWSVLVGLANCVTFSFMYISAGHLRGPLRTDQAGAYFPFLSSKFWFIFLTGCVSGHLDLHWFSLYPCLSGV